MGAKLVESRIIRGMIREELERLIALKEAAERKISDLPRGYIVRRSRNEKEYAYLYWRIGDKIKSQYLGHSDSHKAKELIKKVEERKRLDARRRQLNREIKEIRKQYRVRRKRI